MVTGSWQNTMRGTLKMMRRNAALYVLLIPSAVYLVLFCYVPIYGVQIAFKDFTFADGITGSHWVGWKWFQYFFETPVGLTTIKNTLILSLYSLAVGFPIPILLALVMHNLPSRRFRRVAQTITYLPYFISVVVLVSMLSCFFSINSGWVNGLIRAFGGQGAYFMGEAKYFRHMYVWSGVWQDMGWSSIIYMAALSGVDPGLHEAAMIDGASKVQRIWHIDIPSIMPTIIIMLILRCGSIMSVGFEKTFLMQNSLNVSVSEVISTYNYKQGLTGMKYSYGAAIGLFNNVVNFLFLTIVNFVSGRLSETSLW